MRLIRILLGIVLLVIGSLFSEGYRNSLYLLWLISSAFLVIYSDFITTALFNTKNDLEKYKDKVSALTMLKGNRDNVVQMSIFPESKIIVNQEVKIDLYVTTAIPIATKPDVKLITDTEWSVAISTQPQYGKFYASKYEYILSKPLISIVDDRFIQYSFYIKIRNTGNHNFTIELDDGSINGELNSQLVVSQS